MVHSSRLRILLPRARLKARLSSERVSKMTASRPETGLTSEASFSLARGAANTEAWDSLSVTFSRSSPVRAFSRSAAWASFRGKPSRMKPFGWSASGSDA